MGKQIKPATAVKPPKPAKPSRAPVSKAQLDEFLDRYAPPIARLARASLSKLRSLTPGAVEFVYDNYNALVVGFGPNERASEAILSLVLYPKHVSVCLLQAVASQLDDPEGILRGQGRVVRSFRLEDASTLDRPAVRDLLAQALSQAEIALDPKQKRKMVLGGISPQQRPRR